MTDPHSPPTTRRRPLAWLLAVLLALAPATVALAQTPGAETAESTGAPAKGQSIWVLIITHVDFVTITIAVLSVVALTLIIQGFVKFRRSAFMPDETVDTIRDLIEQKKFKELLQFTEEDDTFVSQAMNSALRRAPNFPAMKEAMETSLGELTADQFRKIEYLNIIGNLGPLLGLLGTVLGMVAAFSAMQAAGGSANPADLAGGISTALAHTFLGLFLAVPCLAAFGVLRTLVDRLTVQGSLTAEELLMLIKPDKSDKSGSSSAPSSRAAAATTTSARRASPVPAPAPVAT